MSNTKLNKPFKHFETIDLFTASKVSVNAENTAYIQNGVVYQGTPDILWEHTAFIHDIAQIWNRGRYYNSQKYMTKMSTISKNIFYDYDKTVITIIDKSFNSLYDKYISTYENYPGILPSIVVAPSVAETGTDKLFALMDKGCDILSTAYDNVSMYDSSASDVENYEEIQNDMIQVEQWLIERSIFTNCYKYPDSSKALAEAPYISKYEEYGVVETNTGINDYTQDNMLLNAFSASSVTSAIDYIDAHIEENKWIIIIVDSSSISGNVSSLISAIDDYVANGDAIYLQMNEAIKTRGSEFNIGRESTLPFKVYKDGHVDALLTQSSITHIYDAIKEDLMRYNAENLFTYMNTYMNTYFLLADTPATTEN